MPFNFHIGGSDDKQKIHNRDMVRYSIVAQKKTSHEAMSGAFLWWNQYLLKEDVDFPPTIPTPHIMNRVWPQIAPLMTIQLTVPDPPTYWSRCRKILMRLTDNPDIPDPLTDFPAFVTSVQKYRRAIRLVTVDLALRYVDCFCPSPLGNFFLENFVFAVLNPVILAVAPNRMEMAGHPSWVEFTNQTGSVDRVFDLFLIFLNPQTDLSADQGWVVRLNMGSLLSSLLFTHHAAMALVDSTAATLFDRLLLMVRAAPEDIAIVLIREAIRICDVALRAASKETAADYFTGLFSNCMRPYSVLRGIVIEWSRSLVGRFLTHRFVCFELLGVTPEAPHELEALAAVAIRSGADTLLVVFRNFCRGMVQRTVWMWIYAQCLSEMIPDACSSAAMRRWFGEFVSRTIMFICAAVWHGKYQGRVFLLLTILASNLFRDECWVWEIIVRCAFSAYSGGMEIFASFFDFPIDMVTDAGWIGDFRKFKEISSFLKQLPFASGSAELYPLAETDAQISSAALAVAIVHPSVRQLSIPDELKQTLGYDADQTQSESDRTIFVLQDLQDPVKDPYRKSNADAPKPYEIFAERRFYYSTSLSVLHTAEEDHERMTRETFAQWTSVVDDAITVLRSDPHFTIDIELLKLHPQAIGQNQALKRLAKFRKGRRDRVSAVGQTARVADVSEQLPALLNAQVMSIKSVLLFTKPSAADALVADVLRNSSNFSFGRAAVTQFYTSDSVDGLKSALQMLTAEFSRLVRQSNEQYEQIIYNAMIRFHFDHCYLLGPVPELRRYPENDAEILIRAAAFAKGRVGDLNLPVAMISQDVRRMPISKYFQTPKLVQIAGLHFLVNPLDMLYLIHQAVTGLVKFFSHKKITPEELRVVFFALFSREPPSNSFGIYRFLEKWDGLQMSAELDKAKALFMDAVRILMPDVRRPCGKS
jgi:hypothetical protein